MTVWRITVDRGGERADLNVTASETDTVANFIEALDQRGFSGPGWFVDGRPLDPTSPIGRGPIGNGSIVATSPNPRNATIRAGTYLVAISGPDSGRWAELGSRPVVVGRHTGVDLTLADRALSGQHFEVAVTDHRTTARDLGSSNGTLVNGTTIPDGGVEVEAGDHIEAGTTTFGIVTVAEEALQSLEPKVGATQIFQRRYRSADEALPRSLAHPSEPSERSDAGKRPLVMYLLPVVTAVGMATITGRWIFLAVMLFAPIAFAVDGLRRRRIQDQEDADKKLAYEQERAAFLDELTAARLEEQRRARWQAPPSGQAAFVAQCRQERLWERRPDDDDFGSLTVGLFNRSSDITVDKRPNGEPLPLDRLRSVVLQHSLRHEGSVAITGAIERARAIARGWMIDLTAAHSPHDLRIWVITEAGAEPHWNAARWLPHTVFDGDLNLIFVDRTQRGEAMSSLKSLINERSGDRSDSSPVASMDVVVIDCLSSVDSDELTDLIEDGQGVGIHFITIDRSLVPAGVRAKLDIGEHTDDASFSSGRQPEAAAVRTCEVGSTTFERAARALASIRPAGTRPDDQPQSGIINLVDLVDAPTSPSDWQRVVDRWNRSSGTSRAVVGGLGDRIIEIDIMADGPHGLIGGATRSGKTEFLKTLITSLAIENHPDDLSIVIVDFKGGVDHRLSARLPHVIDLSTNQDADGFARTIQLLQAEIERRQRLCGTAPNLDAYRVARQADPKLEPLPRLLVIVDEYGEMLSTEVGKSNMKALESITRVGGGFGIHLLLVTQNFENQLPAQISANAGLRVCFRVEEPSHSKIVLKSDEAASIPAGRIGRAYMRAKNGPITELQSARIAGPLRGSLPDERPDARIVPFSTVAVAPIAEKIIDVPAEQTDMYAVIETIREAASRSGWTKSVIPWPKELDADIDLLDLPRDDAWPLGRLDDPGTQSQPDFGWQPFGPSSLLLGSSGPDLASVLRAAVLSAVTRRTPDQLHLYVIDLHGNGLGPLSLLPHVGGLAERSENLGLRILRHVGELMARRKAMLVEAGVGAVADLAGNVESSLPEIVVLVHGVDRLMAHREGDSSPLYPLLLGLLGQSAGTGIRIVLTGRSSVANDKLASAIEDRFVFQIADEQEYATMQVDRSFAGGLRRPGRAVRVVDGRLVQFARIPSGSQEPVREVDVVRAMAKRLIERCELPQGALPTELTELTWPLPIRSVDRQTPPADVVQPVALSVNPESGQVVWLDADEDGPVFAVAGGAQSGRSTALVACASLMQAQNWLVLGIVLSRRSAMAHAFPGDLIDASDVKGLVESDEPIALFLDDAHRWGDTHDTDSVTEFLSAAGARALVLSGPSDFFGSRNPLVRAIPEPRSAIVLRPRSGLAASTFAPGRLADEFLRDARPGCGVQVVAGEVSPARIPFPPGIG